VGCEEREELSGERQVWEKGGFRAHRVSEMLHVQQYEQQWQQRDFVRL